MAERYETKVPVRFTRDGTVTLQQDQGGIYEEMSSKDPQHTEENMYTDLQFGEKQPTSSSSSSNGGAQVGVVRSKTNTKVIIAIAIVFTTCVILAVTAFAMAGVTLRFSQETSKNSTRSSALIELLESQLTEQRQDLNSMRSTLAAAQHSFNTSLHTLLHTRMHPYQNCYTDTTGIRLNPSNTINYYTRRTNTDYLSINVVGYYTLDIRCHIQASSGAYTVVTQLYQSSTTSSMRCNCAVSDPATTTDRLRTLSPSPNFYLDCILSITRCPLTQTIV